MAQKDSGATEGEGSGGEEGGAEKENEAKKPAVVNVGGTEVALRDKLLKQSVSNQSTDGKTQGLSMFDNRAKVGIIWDSRCLTIELRWALFGTPDAINLRWALFGTQRNRAKVGIIWDSMFDNRAKVGIIWDSIELRWALFGTPTELRWALFGTQ